MRVAIVGPGAIGGLLGMRIALAGTPVTFIAHGATLAAIRSQGLTLIEVDGTAHHSSQVDAKVTGSMLDAGPHDVVLLTVKAQQVAALAADLRALIGPCTVVVTMENGLPWWYFGRGYSGALSAAALESVDPGGMIAKQLEAASIIGAVEYVAARHVSATRIEADGGSKIIIGEPDGSRSARIERLSEMLREAGFEPSITTSIRDEVWRKLLVNASSNPASALTHATIGEICRMSETRRLVLSIMKEAEAVARSTGVTADLSPETLIAAMETFGSHKTSMLQDVENGHPTEIDAILGAIVEMSDLAKIAVPTTRSVYALMKLLDQTFAAARGRLTVQAV